MWQLRMHCNLMPPKAEPAIFRFNCDAHAKFEVGQAIRSWLLAFLLLMPYVTLWLDIWPLIVNIYSTSAVTWSNFTLNLSEIQQSLVESLKIYQIFQAGRTSKLYSSDVGTPNCTKFKESRVSYFTLFGPCKN